MVLADSNVWLALAIPKHEYYPVVSDWFASVESPETVSFCRSTQHTFLRLLTTSAVFVPFGSPPLSNKAA